MPTTRTATHTSCTQITKKGRYMHRAFVSFVYLCTISVTAWTQARDPGVRGGAAGAGQPLPGISAAESAAFNSGRAAFQEIDNVSDGLGPRFNLDSCAGCHAAPVVGGSSPA